MLKIGEFSKLSHVSVRMLRHYDEIGLLHPQRVDPITGYRLYGEEPVSYTHLDVYKRQLLGYDVKNGKLTVEPEGAALVRLIFHKYGAEKKGTSVLARELQEDVYKRQQQDHPEGPGK